MVFVNLGMFYYFLNYTDLKLVGIAIAVSSSIIIFNLLKMLFVYSKFKMLPVDIKYFFLFLFMSIILILVYIIPSSKILFVDVAIKVFLIIGLNYLMRRLTRFIKMKKVI